MTREESPQAHNRQIMTALLDILLIALIVFGVILRFSWNNWNQGTSLHPDEYGLTNTLTQLQMPENDGGLLQHAHLADQCLSQIR
jgi:hypothetical protein